MAGDIVVLNGAPRSGKSSIAQILLDEYPGPWVNLGVDVMSQALPERLRPGIGLRPGGERPDLEDWIPALYAALYDSVAAHSRAGLRVVVDVGHHDGYSRPLRTVVAAGRRLASLPAFLVGVRCSLDVVMARRDAGPPDQEGSYEVSGPAGGVPEAVARWQEAVHDPGIYDLEVDTTRDSAARCAQAIWAHIEHGPGPEAFRRLAAG